MVVLYEWLVVDKNVNTRGGKCRPSGLRLPLLQHTTKEIEEACKVSNLEHFNGWMWRRSWDRCGVVEYVCVCEPAQLSG